jgi:hypothetical protein
LRRLTLRGMDEAAIKWGNAAEKSAPVAARSDGPESADRRRACDVRADAAVSQASLHAARIVRPLHCVNDRIETRSHQVAQMSSPAVFALHARSDSDSTLNQRSPANRGSWPYVCNIDSSLPPFSDGCRKPLVFAANCASGHNAVATAIDRGARHWFPALHSVLMLPTARAQGNWS